MSAQVEDLTASLNQLEKEITELTEKQRAARAVQLATAPPDPPVPTRSVPAHEEVRRQLQTSHPQSSPRLSISEPSSTSTSMVSQATVIRKSAPFFEGGERAGFRGETLSYRTWVLEMKAYLETVNMLFLLEPGAADVYAPPDATSNFNAYNRRLYNVLLLSTKKEARTVVTTFAPANDGITAWSALHDMYSRADTSLLLSLQGEYLDLQWQKGETSKSFILRLSEVRNHIRDINPRFDLDDSIAVSLLLRTMPAEYDVIRAISVSPGSKTTLSSLAQQLHAYEITKGQHSTLQPVFHTSPASHTHKPSGTGTTPSRPKTPKVTPGKRESMFKTCGFCDSKDHLGADCAQKTPCERCGYSSHRTAICKAKRHKNGSQLLAAAVLEPSPASKPKTTVAHHVLQVTEDPCLTGESIIVTNYGQVGTMSPWCVDSGSGGHVISQPELLHNAHQPSRQTTLQAPDGESLGQVTLVGDVTLHVHDVEGNIHEVELHNVVFVPGIKVNLLSTRLLKEDNTGFYDPTGGSDEYLQLATGARIPLRIEANVPWVDDVKVITTASVKTTTTLDYKEAHYKWGHVADIKTTATDNNITLTGDDHESMCTCEVCLLAKSRRKPVARASAPRQLNPGELLHADIQGPFEKGINGATYKIGIIDDATRYAATYTTNTKADFLMCIQLFVNNLKAVGIPIGNGHTTLQTDHEMICMSHNMREWSAAEGILLRQSPPYTQAMNGVIERYFQTQTQMQQTLLIQSNLPRTLWPLASQHATYLLNMISCTTLDGNSPHALMFKTKPTATLMDIPIFGTPVFAHVPKEQRDKLDDRSYQGAYVGEPATTQGILVYKPSTHKVLTTYHYDLGTFKPGNVLCQVETPNPENEGDDDVLVIIETPPVTNTDAVPSVTIPTIEKTPVTNTAAVPSSTPVTNTAAVPPSVTIPTTEHPPMTNTDDTVFISHVVTANDEDHPTYDEAINGPEKDEWLKAIASELNALVDNNTFSPVTRETAHGQTILRWKFVLTKKRGLDGTVVKFKARLVVLGYLQREGIDYTNTYAPVASLDTVRVVMAHAAQYNLDIQQMDVQTAFLNAPLDVPLYLEMIPGLPFDQTLVLRMDKSLYGLKQAPFLWNEVFTDALRDGGLQQTTMDPCLFKTDQGVLVIIWVDDTIIVGKREAVIPIKEHLSSTFKMTDLGSINHYLGMEVQRTPKGIQLLSTTYVERLLDKFNMSMATPATTPLPPGLKLNKTMPGDDLADVKEYQQIVGSLMYLACTTRPDIAVAVQQLSRHMIEPTTTHRTAATHVLRYLSYTKGDGLIYPGPDEPHKEGLQGYADADFAGDADSRRSTGGALLTYNGTAISWSSKLQQRVSTSTTEAEYQALNACGRQVLYLRNLLQEVNIMDKDAPPTVIFEDNTAALLSVNSPQVTKATKHVEVDQHWLKQQLQEYNNLRVQQISSANQCADILTKNLAATTHRKLAALVMGRPTNHPP